MGNWVAHRNFHPLPVFCLNARYFCKRVNTNISSERFFPSVTEFICHGLVVQVGNKINWNNMKDQIHLPKMSYVYGSSQSNQLLGVILLNLFELTDTLSLLNFGGKFYHSRTACANEQVSIVMQQMADTKLLIWTVLFGIHVVFFISMSVLPSDRSLFHANKNGKIYMWQSVIAGSIYVQRDEKNASNYTQKYVNKVCNH